MLVRPPRPVVSRRILNPGPSAGFVFFGLSYGVQEINLFSEDKAVMESSITWYKRSLVLVTDNEVKELTVALHDRLVKDYVQRLREGRENRTGIEI